MRAWETNFVEIQNQPVFLFLNFYKTTNLKFEGKNERIDFKADIREIIIDLVEVIINKAINSYDYLGYFQLFNFTLFPQQF